MWKCPENYEEAWNALSASPVRFRDWEMIEIQWGPKNPGIFLGGKQVSVCKEVNISPVAGGELALLAGVFDEMQASADTKVTGTRYQGVVFTQTFDAEKLPVRCYLLSNRERQKPARIPGVSGSPGAFSTPHDMPSPVRVIHTFPSIVVTGDLYVFVTVRSGASRIRLNLCNPYNHFLGVTVKKGEWTPLSFPVSRFGLKTGDKIVQFDICYYGGGNISFAVDNIAFIRGKKESRPTAPAALSAKFRDDAVHLRWDRATDEAGVLGYRVYRSNIKDFSAVEDTAIADTLDIHFTDQLLTHPGAWWYKVAAVDCVGNVGALAGPVFVEVDEER